jgi:hypothetical protein
MKWAAYIEPNEKWIEGKTINNTAYFGLAA